MTNGVLPPRSVLTVVRELLNDVIVNLAQHQHLIGGMQYCHGDESDVRIGRFDVFWIALRGGRGFLSTSLHRLQFADCIW